jgi:hypothetical protein
MARPTEIQPFALGAKVQVRCRFDGRWVSGFVASAVSNDAEQASVRVQRLSDGSVLPYVFTTDEVRPDA